MRLSSTEKIRNDLAAGFGVEDIAVRRKLKPDFIRHYIAHLRNTGKLVAVLRGQA